MATAMELQTLANVGEFIGGLAVVITLGYLAYQTRQTRQLLEQSVDAQSAAMLRANIDGWNQLFATIVSDAHSTEVYARLRAGGPLQDDEVSRAEIIAMMFFLNLENFIIQNQKTPFVVGVEPVVDRAVNFHVRQLLSTAAMQHWWEREQICFSDQFRSVVNAVELG
jgi:hypothetical protein